MLGFVALIYLFDARQQKLQDPLHLDRLCLQGREVLPWIYYLQDDSANTPIFRLENASVAVGEEEGAMEAHRTFHEAMAADVEHRPSDGRAAEAHGDDEVEDDL